MYNETSTKLQPCVCFCAKEDVDLVEDTKAKSKASYKCEAIETVGGSTVGCLNKVQNFRRRKVAEKAAGGLYCDAHIQRIKSHMCCGFCGNFCAHVRIFIRELLFSVISRLFFLRVHFICVDPSKKQIPICFAKDATTIHRRKSVPIARSPRSRSRSCSSSRWRGYRCTSSRPRPR